MVSTVTAFTIFLPSADSFLSIPKLICHVHLPMIGVLHKPGARPSFITWKWARSSHAMSMDLWKLDFMHHILQAGNPKVCVRKSIIDTWED
jgi:hypothetical protein